MHALETLLAVVVVIFAAPAALLDEDWVQDGWEDPTILREKRPPRRYYQLIDDGRLALGGVLQQARTEARFADLRWRFA